eukprot:2778411-Pyramimonas_sp.AAC.1
MAWRSTSSSISNVKRKCIVAMRALPLCWAIEKGGIGKSLPATAHGACTPSRPLLRILSSVPEHRMMGSPSVMKPSVSTWSSKAKAVLARVGSRGEYEGSKDMAP